MISIRLPENYSSLPNSLRQQISTTIQTELTKAVNELRTVSPVGSTGELKGGWQYVPVSFSGEEFTFQIVNNSDHALNRLEGRPAGRQPPSSALDSWVQKKLGISGKEASRVAFLVARKIGKEGTDRGAKPPTQFDPTTGNAIPNGIIDTAVKDITGKLNSLV